MDGKDVFVGYNHTTHALDFFDFTNKKFLKSIAFQKEGPNAIPTAGSFAVNKDFITIIYGNAFIYFLNHEGTVLKKIKFDQLEGMEGLSLSPLELTYGNYSKLSFSDDNVLTLPVYKAVKRLNDDFYEQLYILDIHFDGLNIANTLITCSFPSLFKDNFYGDLDLPYVDRSNGKLVYNFPISSTVYQIAKNDDSSTHNVIELNKTDDTDIPPLSKSSYSTGERVNYFFNSPRYFYPIFDPYRELYYMVRKNKTESLQKKHEESYLMIFNSEFEYLDSIKLSSKLTPIYDVTREGLVFLYNQANIKSESYLSFYTIKVDQK
ncbi:hypothetical protein SanaruYs_10940 [Chryseotalea sanaruensis]|uniref:DUF4221 domain-containing protein n=2 Tax=Chryseotalea sanaruensis TaxID=2482724 RepID=A0A401U7L4_9BACT|nr:hypothetical protein SanaruYs_10940 [Chryseotalea sanaruensis]